MAIVRVKLIYCYYPGSEISMSIIVIDVYYTHAHTHTYIYIIFKFSTMFETMFQEKFSFSIIGFILN